jgi:hypothetical protein
MLREHLSYSQRMPNKDKSKYDKTGDSLSPSLRRKPDFFR